MSDDDDAAGFEIDQAVPPTVDSETVCAFCLVPESQAERDFLNGEKFHYYNKDQCNYIFTPVPNTALKTEWKVSQMEVVKS